MKMKTKTAQRLQNSSERLLSRTRRSRGRNHPIPHQSSQSYHPRMMHSPWTSRPWSSARPADEAWYRRRIPQSPQINQPQPRSPLGLALSKSASSAQLPPPGTALTIPPILSPAGGVMKKTTGLLWGPKNGVSSVSYQNPQNWADYNSRPSVPVQFFLNLRPPRNLRPKPP
jgi:hypothetical protein